MTRSEDNRWLHRFAVFTAVATLALIGVGGLVTSHGAGMAVPDWPTTYGYNMFLFPFSQWVGGIFYEHTHRLVASAVGLLTTILAVWLGLKESRAWLRRLGYLAFFLVVFQGVLGGLRVTLFKDELGIFHATLAQLFLILICAIALVTSRAWRIGSGTALPDCPRKGTAGDTGSHAESPHEDRQDACPTARGLRFVLLAVTILIFGQLILGATMRHQHAGLAVPDFPLAYGELWPAMDDESVARYNSLRMETTAYNSITAFQIGLHMAHRIGAVLILVAVVMAAARAVRSLGKSHRLTRWVLFWAGLILLQAVLGAATVLSNKAADVATLHVGFGALSLAVGALLVIWCWRAAAVGNETFARAADQTALASRHNHGSIPRAV